MAERIAIVGTRRSAFTREDSYRRARVEEFVRNLPLDAIVVSGGAVGVDSWAEQAARKRGLGVLVFCIPAKHMTRQEFMAAAFGRSRRIIEHADRVVAFWDGQSGGTRYTIDYAREQGKPVEVIRFEPAGIQVG